jgi:hypothetical protein
LSFVVVWNVAESRPLGTVITFELKPALGTPSGAFLLSEYITMLVSAPALWSRVTVPVTVSFLFPFACAGEKVSDLIGIGFTTEASIV